jgi:hypothetical protein
MTNRKKLRARVVIAALSILSTIHFAQARDSDPNDAANGMAGVATAKGGFFDPPALIIAIDGQPPPGTGSTLLRQFFAIRGNEHYSILPGSHEFDLQAQAGKQVINTHAHVVLFAGHTYRFVGGWPVKFEDTTNGLERSIPLVTYNGSGDSANAAGMAMLQPLPPPQLPAQAPMTYDDFLKLHPRDQPDERDGK